MTFKFVVCEFTTPCSKNHCKFFFWLVGLYILVFLVLESGNRNSLILVHFLQVNSSIVTISHQTIYRMLD